MKITSQLSRHFIFPSSKIVLSPKIRSSICIFQGSKTCVRIMILHKCKLQNILGFVREPILIMKEVSQISQLIVLNCYQNFITLVLIIYLAHQTNLALIRRKNNGGFFDFIYEKAPSGEGAFYTYSFLFPAALTPPESLR